MKPSLCLVMCVLSVLFLKACQPIERTAYETVVGAKAFLDSERGAHPECRIPLPDPDAARGEEGICDPLRRAVSAKDALIDAIEVYCNGPQFQNGGACTPPSKDSPAYLQVRDKLQAAIAVYNQTAADVKGAAR